LKTFATTGMKVSYFEFVNVLKYEKGNKVIQKRLYLCILYLRKLYL